MKDNQLLLLPRLLQGLKTYLQTLQSITQWLILSEKSSAEGMAWELALTRELAHILIDLRWIIH